MNILQRLATSSLERAARDQLNFPLSELRRCVKLHQSRGMLFESQLKQDRISFICEIKRASPSKGLIVQDFPYIQIAKEYEMSGADCISVLTEPEFFLGSDRYLSDISRQVEIPILRKDFTICEYQIYQAAFINAHAILLICSLLDPQKLLDFLQIADQIGIAAVTETHNEKEVEMALNAGSRIIGVNNRNLTDFSVNLKNCISLRSIVPKDRIFIAESGIKSRADVEILEEAEVDALLIGEALMVSLDKKATLRSLSGVDYDKC
ncbi:MAG: indole-3-glycerol phosphate synthase TrpC [Christensenellaceae bacterium]|jgi:indole-3-glycerol phosphate synthase|nr:indole-3-glycerol phosphate synthase TrpC [Christensenellaceae bacterium]